MNRELLEKYLSNNYNAPELALILNWFNDYGETAECKALLQQIWERNDKASGEDIEYDSILHKIHHQINLIHSKEVLENASNNINNYYRRKHYIRALRNIAALLLLPVLGFAFYLSVKYLPLRSDKISTSQAFNEVYSSVDAITKVTLPDGSSVYLNHSSSLKYPATFNGKSRIVELKGEGFFDIAHNPKIPFVVEVGDLQVIAHGTRFNIMSYPEEDKIETSLISGSVELLKSESSKETSPLVKMKPGELAIYHKDNEAIDINYIIDDRYFSWKDGKLVFTAEPMGSVIKKLSRWFNVDIQIKDTELSELSLTATFVHETLPQVMDLIAYITPLNYSITNREENSDGTFTKRKVILTSKKH